MAPIVFNVISGKGGTGKTLLTAALADALGKAGAKVLVIDLDIFVRGLTTMLYHQRQGSNKIITDGRLSTSDIFYRKIKQNKCGNKSNSKNVSSSTEKELYVETYPNRAFYVSPAVSHIAHIYPFHDIMPDTVNDAIEIVSTILKKVNDQSLDDPFDYIFLDSRAGYDEVVSAAYLLSDYSICVDEDDKVSLVTANNLIKQLKSLKSEDFTSLTNPGEFETPFNNTIFRVRNKAHRYDHKKPRGDNDSDIEFLGFIPFDADVRACFGKGDFWNIITRNLYMDGLCNAWNQLVDKEGLNDKRHILSSTFSSAIGSKRTEEKLSVLPTPSRISYVSGFILLVLGAILISLYSDFWMLLKDGNIYVIVGLLVILLGTYLLFASIVNANRKTSSD